MSLSARFYLLHAAAVPEPTCTETFIYNGGKSSQTLGWVTEKLRTPIYEKAEKGLQGSSGHCTHTAKPGVWTQG